MRSGKSATAGGDAAGRGVGRAGTGRRDVFVGAVQARKGGTRRRRGWNLLARSLGDKAKESDRLKDARQDARTAWMDALGWWKKYGDDHPEESRERPSSSPGRAAAVRQMRARAQAMLGDEKAAPATYEDLTEPMAPLEKVAALYRVRRVKP